MMEVVIVGNIFKEFKDGGRYITSDDLINTPSSYENYKITIGQGLTGIEKERLKLCHCLNINEALTAQSIVNKKFVHKTYERNVLLSNFRVKEHDSFESDICLSGDNDLLQDHITGIHIPGIVLTESARQFTLASLSHYNFNDYRFILNSLSSEFISYVFPDKVQLNIEINFLKDSKIEKKIFAKINLTQHKKSCGSFNISATLLPEKIASFNEILSKKNGSKH